MAIIQHYASNTTALNLVVKLSSKIHELTAKKFNVYVEANKQQVIEKSKIDFCINNDYDEYTPIVAKTILH